MAKDYKNSRRGGARNTKRAPRRALPWRSFVIGVLCGAIPVAGVFTAERMELISFSGADARRPVAQAVAATEDAEPVSQPRFEFYTMLPEMEVAVKDEELEPRPKKESTEAKSAALPGTYLLQVGSFRGHDDADSLKASLALLGLEAQIQTVSINGEETWHRVRLGPFTEREALNTTRERLVDNDIEAIVLKKRE